MPIKAIAAISGPFDFYPFEYDEVRNVFGKTDNPEGTQPINLVTADEPPMLLALGQPGPDRAHAEHRPSRREAARRRATG